MSTTATISRVVLHADDYGMNAAVNQGILQAFREGVLTSTSLLTNAPAAQSAADLWPALIADQTAGRISSAGKRRSLCDPAITFDLGVHLNLTQGRPLTGDRYPSDLLNDGKFPGIGALFFRINRLRPSLLPAVAAELQAQIEWMCDRGLSPKHLNGHQYIEMMPQIAVMIPELLRRYSILTVRVAHESNLARSVLKRGRVAAWGLGLVKQRFAATFRQQVKGFTFPDQFFGTSHAGQIDQPTFESFLAGQPRVELTEVGIHPALTPIDHCPRSDPWFDPLANNRANELRWLCDDDLPRYLERNKLQLGRLSKGVHSG